MLIDLLTRPTIDPTIHPGTLVVRIQTDNRPECGVFAGRHAGFTPDEEGKAMPRIGVGAYCDLGIFDFVVDRPGRNAREHQILRYNYLVIGWDNAVYVQHQDIWHLTLQELSDGWSVSLNQPNSGGFTLILSDYEPGWMARTGTKAL